MQFKKLLLLASVAVATKIPAPVPNPVRDVAPRQTTDSNIFTSLLDLANSLGLSACIPQALPLVTELPTIPKGFLNNDLIQQALSQTTLKLSDVCSFSITGTAGTTFTNFLPTIYSFYSAHSSTIGKIISACPSASAFLSTVIDYETCTQVASVLKTADLSATTTAASSSGGTATAASTTAASTTGTSTGAKTSKTSTAQGSTTAASTSSTATVQTTASLAGAPRETGVVLAAIVAAGFIGAVAAL